MSPNSSPTTDWRCTACRTLFGVPDDNWIELRYKTALFRVRGEVTTRCRRCGTPSQFTTYKSPPDDTSKGRNRKK